MDTPKQQPQQPEPEMTLEESVKEVMQSLPPVVRDYLKGGKYMPVVKELMTKYDLHIDQAGVLEREIMLLLLGVQAPEAFVKTLGEEAKLDPRAVKSLVEDVNAKIFAPLREREEKEEKSRAPSAPDTAPTPARAAAQTIPKTALAPGAPMSRFGAVRPLDASKLLEDHEEPHVDLHKPAAPAPLPRIPFRPPRPGTPLSPPATTNVPARQAAPSWPVAAPKAPIMPVSPSVQTQQAAPAVAPPPAPAPAAAKPLVSPPAPAKPYAVDPYREPVDEPPGK